MRSARTGPDQCSQTVGQTGVVHLRHVEAHHGAGRLCLAEDIAGRQHQALLQARLGQAGAVDAFRQAAPQKHPVLGLVPGPQAQRIQLPDRAGHGPRQPLAQPPRVLLPGAVAQQPGDDGLGQAGA